MDHRELTLANLFWCFSLQGRMIELEHSKLAGPAVKFKTVINYNRVLEEADSLGVALVPQEGYINKFENSQAENQQWYGIDLL